MSQTVVFTNGCFDKLHIGHMQLLRQAKALGDFLIVGLNSDESVRRLKGEGRPLNRLSHRYEMLSGIKYVDSVFIFTDDTPENLIYNLKPDILVKGEDWKNKEVVGAEFVKSNGGKVIFIPHKVDISTTKVIEKEMKDEK